MKRIIALIIALMMVVCGSCIAEIDWSQYSDEELTDFIKQIQNVLINGENFSSVTLPLGAYKIGEDIPAGQWTITIATKGYAQIHLDKELNAFQTEIAYTDDCWAAALYNSDLLEDAFGRSPSITLYLPDGYYLVIEDSQVVLSSPNASLQFN